MGPLDAVLRMGHTAGGLKGTYMVDLGPTGLVTFTFRCNTSRQVSLAGDFNDWNPQSTPMERGQDGMWYVTLRLPPGQHQFRYHEDGGAWHTDFAAFGVVRNDFGEFNSLVDVPQPMRTRAQPAEKYPFSLIWQ
jgi:1,4-alpha-glucan branching enzyme